MKKVEFTETILRDANQSLIATRLPYEKFAPMLAEMDKAGFYSVECWGGVMNMAAPKVLPPLRTCSRRL